MTNFGVREASAFGRLAVNEYFGEGDWISTETRGEADAFVVSVLIERSDQSCFQPSIRHALWCIE
jgi:hypothetical protein